MNEKKNLTPINPDVEREQLFPVIPGITPRHIPPLPDAQGIAEVKELYCTELGKELTDEEAYIILSRTIRFIWSLNVHTTTKPEITE